MKTIIILYLAVQFLGISRSDLFAQDVYTKLKLRYQTGEIDQKVYSSKVKSLYSALQSGQYSPEAGESNIKCLFPIQVEAIKHSSSLEKSAKTFAKGRPLSQASYKTEEGHFKIHYDTTGVNAVDTTNLLGNAVPDWIFYTGRAYERGWSMFVDSLGYQIPPVDTIDGDQIDVFIRELSPTLAYGTTYAVDDTGFAQNAPSITFIEMDDDFSESIYFSNGLDGMRVTAVHELFHVFQLGYTFRPNDVWFFELTATWIEDLGYDSINDYLQYIEFYYSDTDKGLHYTNGFNVAIFGKFIQENYDAHVIRGAWEKMLTNKAEIALDLALKENAAYEPEGGLKAAWGKFAIWNWFTGSRKVPGAFFEEGELYPELEPYSDTTFSGSVLNIPFFGLEELSFRINRFIPIDDARIKAAFTAAGNPNVWSTTLTAGPPDITFLNPGSAVNVNEVSNIEGLIVAVSNGSIEGDGGSVRETYSLEVAITGAPPANLIALYPNPFKTQTDITFELKADNTDITFTVYNLLGQTVHRQTKGFFLKGENRIVYSPADNLASGIYFFRISGDEVEINGKFTLLR